MENHAVVSSLNQNMEQFWLAVLGAMLSHLVSCLYDLQEGFPWTYPLWSDSWFCQSPFELQSWCCSCQDSCLWEILRRSPRTGFFPFTLCLVHVSLKQACYQQKSCNGFVSQRTIAHCELVPLAEQIFWDLLNRREDQLGTTLRSL